MLSVENIHGNIKNLEARQKEGESSYSQNNILQSRNNSPMLPDKKKKDSEKISDTSSSNKTGSNMQDSDNWIQIENCDVEGEQKISSIVPYYRSNLKLFLSAVITIASGFIYALFLRNSLKILLKSVYNKSTPNNATHFLITNCDGKQEIVKRFYQDDRTKIQFINRHMKYQYFDDGNKKCFYPVYYHQIEKQPLSEIKRSHQQGLTPQKVEAHLQKYGNCQINIPIPSLLAYLGEVLSEIFFIFQYFTMVLWFLEGYVLFSIVMLCASVSITILNYFLLRLSLKKLKNFAKNDQKVKVIRNGQEQTVQSVDLLPGDVFYYQNDMALPCDSLLISGDVLVNESSLTGESIPIPKISIEQNEQQNEIFNIKTMKNHVLYEGTRIIQTKGEQVQGIVLRTGFTSFRGCIFRAMLYPKEIKFNFYKNGIYFLLILMFIGIVVYFIELKYIIDVGVPTILIIYRFFDAATWMIPPALPIFFSVCQTVSLLRLGGKKILATDPAKVVVAGDVSIMCFDKTGTLTKDDMEIYGYSDYRCNQIKKELTQESEKEKLLHKFFGSCHGVYLINGQNLGDELDVKMLEFSKYKIINENSKDYKFRVQNEDQKQSILTIYKVWEFESSLQRMTAIMQDQQTQKIYGIVKGSPEKIHQMCVKQSIDQNNFNNLLNQLTNKGLRVIAFGYKELASTDVSREVTESNIEFLGLFVLENKLKPDTADVIKRLQNGNILCKVISGDNLLTTIQCAKEANIIPNDPSKIIICNSMSDCHVQSTLEKKEPIQFFASSEPSFYKIGITGGFLEEIQNHFNQSFGLSEKQMLSNLLNYTYVFSRCKPQQKAEIVHLFQTHLNEKVGMIGDGANDCSAIKQADIGISFTKTDASYSSPFSYSENSLDCVIKILGEGRCTLTNMIECYRYYLTASVNKYTIACILILELSNMASFQVVFINYFVNIPFLLFLAFSRPLDDLSPHKPISNMLDIENFFCIYGQIIIQLAQFLTHYFVLRSQDWYVEITQVVESNTYVYESMSISILFLACVMVFIFSILSYYISYPSKLRIYQNKVLTGAMSIVFIFTILLYLIPNKVGRSLFSIYLLIYKVLYLDQVGKIKKSTIPKIFYQEIKECCNFIHSQNNLQYLKCISNFSLQNLLSKDNQSVIQIKKLIFFIKNLRKQNHRHKLNV